MFKKAMVNHCLLGVVAITATACSSTDTRPSAPIREALPTIPVQPRVVTPPPSPQISTAPQNNGVYDASVFEEYKPQSTGPYARAEETYESYVPEDYAYNSYTTPLEQSPPAVIERLSPPPLVEKAPEPVNTPEPVEPEVEDLSKNELDIDPFADVPERPTSAVSRPSTTQQAKPAPQATTRRLSAAANALLNSAKSDASSGRYDSAINKVERALRIEPNSAELWYQLANLNHGKGRHDQAISLARKSLGMSGGDRNMASKNLDLMSKAATKSGNTRVFKEVLDYKRTNL
ncbi:tetratricopeptide repeat protein [Leucothrix sargassi]|nr:tetratricopeptide repeat protein [Leucothrix sargassi]